MRDPIRYAVIGTGMMGNEHIANLALIEGAQLVAAADPHEGSRDWAAQTVQAAQTTQNAQNAPSGREAMAADDALLLVADYRELLAARDLFDAVIVATPNHTHRAILEDVLATGKHVLIEKPLCTTLEDCLWVREAARGYPGVLWVGLEYRWMPPVTRFVEEVRAGAVGALKMLTIREHRFPFLPKIGDWNRFNRNTGGTLVEKSCHFFDLMRHVTGAEPVRVMASGGQDVNHLDERYDGETPDILDNAYVIVEFANGVRACHELCMFVTRLEQREHITAAGTRGALEVRIPESELAFTENTGDETRREKVAVDADALAAGSHHGASYHQHLAFQRAIREGRPAEVGVEDGLRSVAMGLAAQQAIAQRRVVEMAEFGL